MKFWTHPSYKKFARDLYNSKDIEHEIKFGNFKIQYSGFDNSEYFGVLSWKNPTVTTQLANFFENDNLIFSKKITRQRECHFVIGGDGLTREGTFYLCKNEVYDFNDVLIKTVCLGPDYLTGIISIAENYFVAITEECCTYSRFFGLFDKTLFFVKENEECWDGQLSIPAETLSGSSVEEALQNVQNKLQTIKFPRPYNNARVGLAVDSDGQCYVSMEPIEVVENGLIFADVQYSEDSEYNRSKFYTKTEFVAYENIGNYDQHVKTEKEIENV